MRAEGCGGLRPAWHPRLDAAPDGTHGGIPITETGLAKRDIPSAAVYQRRDWWWVEPTAILVTLSLFVVYSTWAALQTTNFYFTRNGAHYLSPFYSPCLTTTCGPLQFGNIPLVRNFPFSPAILILGAPLGFRLTCYYYRKAYYRSFFRDPTGCAVAEGRRGYRGETAFPFILQNAHRYFLILALLILIFLWYDALLAFAFTDTPDGSMRFGASFIGVFLVLNATLLTLYTFGCHSLRHVVGGGSDCFSCTLFGKAKKETWKGVTVLNERHMLWAWLSLFSVALGDVLVRLTAMEIIPDVRFF